jgi:hypothetical protein
VIVFESQLSMNLPVNTSGLVEAAQQSVCTTILQSMLAIARSRCQYVSVVLLSDQSNAEVGCGCASYVVLYEITVAMDGYPSFNNSTVFYNTLSESLETAIESGAFLVTLNNMSIAYGATQLANATVGAVETADLVVIEPTT